MHFQNWQHQRCNIEQFYHRFPGDRFHLVIVELLKLFQGCLSSNALRWRGDLTFSYINIKSDLQTHSPFVGPMEQNRSERVLNFKIFFVSISRETFKHTCVTLLLVLWSKTDPIEYFTSKCFSGYQLYFSWKPPCTTISSIIMLVRGGVTGANLFN